MTELVSGGAPRDCVGVGDAGEEENPQAGAPLWNLTALDRMNCKGGRDLKRPLAQTTGSFVLLGGAELTYISIICFSSFIQGKKAVIIHYK